MPRIPILWLSGAIPGVNLVHLPLPHYNEPTGRIYESMTNENSVAGHVAQKLVVTKVAEADFPTLSGHFRILGFRLISGEIEENAVVLMKGTPEEGAVPLVRIHSQCLTGEVFGSLRCDCRDQLDIALARIGSSLYGFIIYEEKEGRGIGLMNKLQAYELQDQGVDTIEANEQLGFEADLRDYKLPTAILQYFRVSAVRLLSNNPDKLRALEKAGISIVERISIEAMPHQAREHYLRTKRERMGHLIKETFDETPPAGPCPEHPSRH